MPKLLRANFSRLWKPRIFHLAVLASALLPLAFVCDAYLTTRRGYSVALESPLFQYEILAGFIGAILAGLFLGTEYSDGTIRNKVAVGHTRAAIYLSNLIVSLAAIALLTLLALATGLASGLLLGLEKSISAGEIALNLGCGLLSSAAFMSLYTMIAMLAHSKASGAVLCLIVVLCMLFASLWIDGALSQPEVERDYVMMVDGAPILSDPRPNPLYVSGAKRTFLEFAYDLLPFGQAVQLSNNNAERMERFPALSLLVVLTTSAAGMVLFRKRDLK